MRWALLLCCLAGTCAAAATSIVDKMRTQTVFVVKKLVDDPRIPLLRVDDTFGLLALLPPLVEQLQHVQDRGSLEVLREIVVPVGELAYLIRLPFWFQEESLEALPDVHLLYAFPQEAPGFIGVFSVTSPEHLHDLRGAGHSTITIVAMGYVPALQPLTPGLPTISTKQTETIGGVTGIWTGTGDVIHFGSCPERGRFENVINVLSGRQPTDQGQFIRSRSSFSEQRWIAHAWIKKQLELTGIEVIDDRFFTSDGIETANLIGILPGKYLSHEVVVIGAHWDSTSAYDRRNAGNPYSPETSPGAEDNASGVSAVLEAARCLTSGWNARTVHFILFGAEEQGLLGSYHYVDNMREFPERYNAEEGTVLKGAVIADMITYNGGMSTLEVEGTKAFPEMTNVAAASLSQVTGLLKGKQASFVDTTNAQGSDHIPFNNVHVPAILLITGAYRNYGVVFSPEGYTEEEGPYHTRNDDTSRLDFDFGLTIMKTMMLTTMKVAGIVVTKPPTPPPTNFPTVFVVPTRPPSAPTAAPTVQKTRAPTAPTLAPVTLPPPPSMTPPPPSSPSLAPSSATPTSTPVANPPSSSSNPPSPATGSGCVSSVACGLGAYCSTDGGCYLASECAVFLDAVEGTCPDASSGCASTVSCGGGNYCSNDGGCYKASECPAFQDAVEGTCPSSGPSAPVCQSSVGCGPSNYCSTDGNCYLASDCAAYLDAAEGTCPGVGGCASSASCGQGNYCSTDGGCYVAAECPLFLDEVSGTCPSAVAAGACVGHAGCPPEAYCATDGGCYAITECGSFQDSATGVCPTISR